MSMRLLLTAVLILPLFAPAAAAQLPGARERANPTYEAGLEHMRNESFDAATVSFQSAVIIDPSFEMAHFMLGRVQLMQRNFTAAVNSLVKARDLFAAQSITRFDNKQEGDRKRRELINDMTNEITRLQQARQTPQVQEQIRQYTERRRQVQDLDRQVGLTPEQAVPGFVYLSLGSAYFRNGRMVDAERAYRAAVATDPKIGEAHNNLAVIYMESGRLAEAENALKAAERAGLRVNPALKDEIKRRR